MALEGFDLDGFWKQPSDYVRKKFVLTPPTDEMIRSVEEELGYKLPESYLALMRVHR